MSHYQTKHKWWVLIGTCTASLGVALTLTIVHTALGDIGYSLGTSMRELQWFITGFGITFCSFMTTMGRLADMLGRKKLLHIGLFVFVIASIGAGVSYSSIQLIIFRLIQGTAGALIFPASMTIIVDAFPKKEKGKALGIYGSIVGIGFGFGPVLGGLITEFMSWRWIFYVNVPLMILSFIIISLIARESKLAVKPKIDWLGMFWLTVFISSLIYILTEGDLYGWLSMTSITFFIISFLAFMFFIITEYKSQSPLLPLSLFKNNYVIIGCIIYIICASSAWVISFYSPLYLSIILKYNSSEIGLMMLAMTLFTVIIPVFAGALYDKKGISVAIQLVFIPLIFSYLLFITLYYTNSLWILISAFALFGIAWGAGTGIGMPTALSNLRNTDDNGVVSGVVLTILNTFGVIFLTLAGIIFYHVQKSVFISSFKFADIQITSEKVKLIDQLIDNPQQRQSMLDHLASMSSNKLLTIYQQSFVAGYVSIALILLCITILAFVIYKWLK